MAVLRRFFGAVFFFGAPVFLFGVVCAVVATYPLFGPIDPENVDRGQLIRLMQFRDFRNFSPQLVAKLSERCDVEFGRRGGKMPEFQFSATEKKMFAYYGGKRKSADTRFETNLNLLARAKYFDWMDQFDAMLPNERPALMNEIIDDMKWWETLYMNFLRAAELPIPSLTELTQDFIDMTESFKIGVAVAEVERIDRFTEEIIDRFAKEVIDEYNRQIRRILWGTDLLHNPVTPAQAGV